MTGSNLKMKKLRNFKHLKNLRLRNPNQSFSRDPYLQLRNRNQICIGLNQKIGYLNLKMANLMSRNPNPKMVDLKMKKSNPVTTVKVNQIQIMKKLETL